MKIILLISCVFSFLSANDLKSLMKDFSQKCDYNAAFGVPGKKLWPPKYDTIISADFFEDHFVIEERRFERASNHKLYHVQTSTFTVRYEDIDVESITRGPYIQHRLTEYWPNTENIETQVRMGSIGFLSNNLEKSFKWKVRATKDIPKLAVLTGKYRDLDLESSAMSFLFQVTTSSKKFKEDRVEFLQTWIGPKSVLDSNNLLLHSGHQTYFDFKTATTTYIPTMPKFHDNYYQFLEKEGDEVKADFVELIGLSKAHQK